MALLLAGPWADVALAGRLSVDLRLLAHESLVQGQLTVTNRGATAVTLDAISASLEAQVPATVQPASLEPRERNASFRVTPIEVPMPSRLPAGHTARVHFDLDLCDFPDLGSARSLRAVATVVVEGRKVRARTRRVRPSTPLDCPAPVARGYQRPAQTIQRVSARKARSARPVAAAPEIALRFCNQCSTPVRSPLGVGSVVWPGCLRG